MSIFWPNVEEEAGRRSAVRRGFWGGVVITLLTALGPPPMGAVSLVVFGLVTAGIALKQPWAPRAGVLAAYAPLLLAIRQPDTGLVFGAFFQCTILAYFFFSAWRGLRAQSGLLQWASGAFWLAVSLAFIYAWHLSGNVQRVTADNQRAVEGQWTDTLIAGDTVLLESVANPKPNQLLFMSSDKPNEPPYFARPLPDAKIDPARVIGAVKWVVWSDAAQPVDPPIAFYTKARWERFPSRVR